ncbi:hypothetical protein GCM10009775_13390 [Microbacterium aoyamense]|uniref:DUF4157 domain-containing protein n=1 Tax=Microbacterium aoyamense TaxID=344166 RepID=A0ABP5ATH6_9MICO|nr:hypothetical protein [Microbacterium aoyamense]
MSPRARRGWGILVACACVLAGGILAERSELLTELAAAQHEVERLDGLLASAERTGADLGDDLALVRGETAVYSVLLDRREDFVSAVAEASRAFASAEGKVDVSSARANVLDAQETVLDEREDAATVAAAKTQVDEITASVTQAVAAYDAEQARLAAAAAAAPSAGGGVVRANAPLPSGAYERVRAALDRVGGGGVPLQQFDGACGGGSAAACASSSGVIFFTAGLAAWSDARLHWAMAHELAHIFQFRVWGPLQASGSYAALYGGNIELLANCMAAHRGYPSGSVSCSGAQIDFGAAIWSGYVPG